MADLFSQTTHPFFIRLKDNRLIKWAEGSKGRPRSAAKRPLKDFFNDLPDDKERHIYKFIAGSELTIAGKKSKDGELVVVCSNIKDPRKILPTYRKRWNIETCFRNMKTQGFNLENTHMVDPNRLSKLMAIISMAMLFIGLIGLTRKCPFKKTVGTSLYSVFTKGLRFIQHHRADDPIFLIGLLIQAVQDLSKSEG